jgi:hypothetical protein
MVATKLPVLKKKWKATKKDKYPIDVANLESDSFSVEEEHK